MKAFATIIAREKCEALDVANAALARGQIGIDCRRHDRRILQ